MAAPKRPTDYLLQRPFWDDLRTMGEGDWLVVCELPKKEEGAVYCYCALVSVDGAEGHLDDRGWTLHLGSGLPGTITSRKNGEWAERYVRLGNDDGIEPLVVYRDWHGLRSQVLELSEEFRFFHDLHESKPGRFVKLDHSGDEREVAVIEPRLAKVRVKELREYLAVRKMCLIMSYQTTWAWKGKPEDHGLTHEQRTEYREADVLLKVIVLDSQKFMHDDRGTLSYGDAKKVIRGYNELPEGWGGEEQAKKFEDFIIGVKDGKNITSTCDPSKLDKPGSAHYLQPVHFAKKVLQKYQDNPVFTVDDGRLSCGGLWLMNIDNDHDDRVLAFLGDLGRDLPEKEQLHWKAHNIPPDKGISETSWKRNFEAEFADPKQSDLRFKQRFAAVQEHWQKTAGWMLWKPLAPGDQHLMASLRIPVVETQKEFDDQVLALAKILIDSLNEAKLAEGLTLDAGTKGMKKLEAWLKARGAKGFEPHLLLLHRLYGLRHGTGHRKGEDYVKAADHFKLGQQGFTKAFDEVLQQAIALLDYVQGLATKPAAKEPGLKGT